MAKIVTFGEYLMRLSPEYGRRLPDCEKLEMYYGGSEMNAAALCALCGDETVYITAVPAHEIGQASIRRLRELGIDFSYVVRSGNRIGIYFCDSGSSNRPTKVIYDRVGSSFAEADPQSYDFEAAMKDADWFHFSGITPAVSEKALEATKLALKAAKKNGLTVSCDLNYRGKLWTMERAKEVMVPLMEYVDVCIANEADVKGCLGIETDGRDIADVLREISEKFGFTTAASLDIDNHSASHNEWSGVLYHEGKIYTSPKINLLPIIDRIGAGDAMAGGLIHALRKWNDPEKAIAFSSAAGAMKATVYGDYSCTDEAEILALCNKGTQMMQR